MTSLCLAFHKYLLGTRCAEQYSLSFHKQTGNSLTASLLQSVLHPHPPFHVTFGQVENNVNALVSTKKKSANMCELSNATSPK